MYIFHYGPPLRELVSDLFGNSNIDSGDESRTSARILGGIRATERAIHHSPNPEELKKLVKYRMNAEKSATAFSSEHAQPGDVVLIERLSDAGSSQDFDADVQMPIPVVLDSPAPSVGQNMWQGWIASAFTAYAAWYDVLLDMDSLPPVDPRACMVHADQRVILALDFVRQSLAPVSATTLAHIRAVWEEFVADKIGRKANVIQDENGIRETLGGLKVMTGSRIDRPDDIRRVFRKLYLFKATEITEASREFVVRQQSTVEAKPGTARDSLVRWLSVISFGSFLPVQARPAGLRAASSPLSVSSNDPERLVGMKDEQSGVDLSIAIVSFERKRRVEIASSHPNFLAGATHLRWMGLEIELEHKEGHVFLHNLTPAEVKSFLRHAFEDEKQGRKVCLRFIKTG